MEWRPAGWSVCLPLLIFPCTIKSRSSLLAPAHLGGPGKRAVKRLWWCGLLRWSMRCCWAIFQMWYNSSSLYSLVRCDDLTGCVPVCVCDRDVVSDECHGRLQHTPACWLCHADETTHSAVECCRQGNTSRLIHHLGSLNSPPETCLYTDPSHCELSVTHSSAFKEPGTVFLIFLCSFFKRYCRMQQAFQAVREPV